MPLEVKPAPQHEAGETVVIHRPTHGGLRRQDRQSKSVMARPILPTNWDTATMIVPALLPPILRRPAGFSMRGFLTGIVLSSVVGAALYVFLTTL